MGEREKNEKEKDGKWISIKDGKGRGRRLEGEEVKMQTNSLVGEEFTKRVIHYSGAAKLLVEGRRIGWGGGGGAGPRGEER